MLVKLFDLWDLDDSSVRHVLPSSSYICRSEPIHSPKRSLCYANGLENHLSELSGADTDLCKQCKSPNRDDANWCIECGTAMVGTSVSSADSQAHCDISLVPEPHSPCSNFSVKSRHEATYTSTYNSPSQQVNFHLDKNSTSNIESASHHTPDKVTQLQGQSRIGNGQVNHLYECDSVVRHTHVTDHLIANKQTDSTPKSSDTLAFPPISTTQQNAGRVRKKDTSSLMGTRNNYQRHWNSSSVYRWRKPSSIQKCNLQTLPGDVPGGCTNPTKICSVVHGGHSAHVPVIDLSALQSDFKLSLKCISTRKSSSINVVRTNFSVYSRCILFFLILACLSQSPALPLLLLPDEIILTVLSSLSQKDLANCMLVCRRLFHIASLCKSCLNVLYGMNHTNLLCLS